METEPGVAPEGGRAPRRPRVREERAKKRGGLLAFFLVGAVPAAALAWFFLQPEEDRRALLDKIPEGGGGRAIKAAIAFGILVALARVALPAFHGASAGLNAVLDRFRSRRGVLRVLLFPLEALVGFVWLLAQVLFAVDAVLIVAASLALLLLAVRIVKPDFLPGFLPDLGG